MSLKKTIAETWANFLADDPYSPSLRIGDDGFGSIWIVARYDQLPSVFSLRLGELLYHLRAALDECVYNSAALYSCENPPRDSTKLEFPICGTIGSFQSAAWKISSLPDELKSIIESVQPYKTPSLEDNLVVLNVNRSLGILNDWARKDRHRKVLTLGSLATRVRPQLQLPDGCQLTYLRAFSDRLIEPETKIAEFQIAGWKPGMDIRANPDTDIDLTVDESPPKVAASDTFSNRLDSMLTAAEIVVRQFEEYFRATRYRPSG